MDSFSSLPELVVSLAACSIPSSSVPGDLLSVAPGDGEMVCEKLLRCYLILTGYLCLGLITRFFMDLNMLNPRYASNRSIDVPMMRRTSSGIVIGILRGEWLQGY